MPSPAVPNEPGAGAPPRAHLRSFLRFAAGYWVSPSWREAWLYSVGAVALGILQVLLQLALNQWIGRFFNSLEARDSSALWLEFGLFVLILTASMTTAALGMFTKMSLQIGWRAWMTERFVGLWLERSRHYLLQFFGSDNDNPDQRIADDIRVVCEAAVDFALGLLNSALLLAGFVGVLWSLSTPLQVSLAGFEFEMPGYLVGAAVAYASVGSLLAYLLGRPMIKISEALHAREGDFRFNLVRVRESSEAVALLRGEGAERQRLRGALAALVAGWRRLAGAQRRLTFATSGYTAAAPIVPLLVAAPRFFAGSITLGGLMQASAAFVQIQLALGFFVDNFARLSDWRAAVNRIARLAERAGRLEAELIAAEETSVELKPSSDGNLRFANLHLESPDGVVVIDQATAELRPGEKVLIVGESGAGKTTLLKAIAGLYPWGKGQIEVPAQARIVFVPQRPYFPLGTLRAALAYPESEHHFPDDLIGPALARCGLAHLAPRLGETARWDQALSDGEQQRFSFARLLVHRPNWILMDEATSALDDREQAEMMALLRDDLAEATVLSAGLRSGLREFHDRTLTLVRSPGGTRLVRGIVVRPPAPSAAPPPAGSGAPARRWLRRSGGASAP